MMADIYKKYDFFVCILKLNTKRENGFKYTINYLLDKVDEKSPIVK